MRRASVVEGDEHHPLLGLYSAHHLALRRETGVEAGCILSSTKARPVARLHEVEHPSRSGTPSASRLAPVFLGDKPFAFVVRSSVSVGMTATRPSFVVCTSSSYRLDVPKG